jgi:filamentous hemagglutinin family protein
MLSCASAAIAVAALAPRPAQAQSAPLGAFRGDITSQVGSVTRNQTSNTTETITIGSNTATINWSPTDTATGGGPIDFLPTGNVATFTSSPGVTFYTVLNRIVPNDPSRSILLDGSVISTLEGTSTIGGNVWFYSPGGIVVGPNAMFDVGGLLLTTADLPNGFGADETGFSGFFSASDSTSSIQILDGAQINARDSYVALVAPRIEQGGTVSVDGSAAYVAAEQLTMTFDQGLFDISLDLGTDDPNGLVHSGTTTGTGNATADDRHTIYMVAVPKNNALTMLLSGGSVGFTDAVGATVENGQIILSAGYGVSHDDSRNVVIDGLYLGGAVGGAPASIDIQGGDFTSSLDGYATGFATADGGGGTLNFDHNVSLQGIDSASLVANAGDTVTVGGSATISSNDLRDFSVANPDVTLPLDAQGGTAAIIAQQGGSISIAGNASVSADARAATNGITGAGGTAQGGFATMQADGGTLSIGGDANVSASGLGWNFASGSVDGTASFGGFASLESSSSGNVTIGGGLEILAEGLGSFSSLASGGTGGAGYGGAVSLSANTGGSISVAGATEASASGVGGTAPGGPDGTGGAGSGGSTNLSATEGGSVSFGADADFFADGIGGNSPQGGEGDGGSASLFIDGGTITSSGRLALFADGIGGNGFTAGNGFGGTAQAMIGGGEGASAGGTLGITGEFRLQAAGDGGNGFVSTSGTGGNAGNGYGGFAHFYTTNFLQPEAAIDVTLGTVAITANGNGGVGGNGLTGGNGGSGYGGEALTELFGGSVSAGNFQTFATARGGLGGTGSDGAGGAGGSASGGSSTLTIGTVVFGSDFSSYARGLAADGGAGSAGQGDGGSAAGGDATIDVLAGAALNGNADVNVTAYGGNGGNGGYASGGDATLSAEGTVNANSINIDASATGGNGSSGIGGASQGGIARLLVDGGIVNAETGLNVRAVANENSEDDEVGNGGNGVTGGGQSQGGSAIIELTSNGGDLHVGGDTELNSRALGGAATGNGTGGDGYGGYSGLIVDVPGSEATAILGLSEVGINANGLGGVGGTSGPGGTGGIGYGGWTEVSIGGGTFGSGNIFATARGRGGAGGTGTAGLGGNGGYGEGGSNTFWAAGASAIDSASYTSSANGAGGAGGSGSTGFGDGGIGQGGYGEAVIDSTDANFADDLVVTAFGNGGNGANGGNAYGGTSNITINGSLTTTYLQSTGQSQGGVGSEGTGGSADSGNATVTVNGTLASTDMLIATNAIGGAGTSGGGNAFAGNSNFFVYGSAQLSGQSSVQADAIGGNASAGTGGYAEAGWVDIEAWNGGIASFVDLTATADGLGGSGTDGGYGDGGSTFVSAQGGDGHINVTGQAMATAVGVGGSGSSSGVGGDGFGGEAEISGVGGHTNVANALIRSSGFGGSGGTGGDGFGGSSIAGSRFGGLTVTGNLTEYADGYGGEGLNGDGGEGDGGLAFINANLSGDTGATATTIHNAVLTASGIGGSTSTPGATGGSASGGFIQVFGSTELGTLSIDQLLANANGSGGSGSTVGFGSGGSISLSAENDSANGSAGSVHVGNAVLHADASGESATGGLIDLFSEGGNLTVDSATLTANAAASGGGIFLFSEAGSAGQIGQLNFGTLAATANGGSAGFGGEVVVWADGGTTIDLGNAALGAGFIELLAGLESAADITASQLLMSGSDIFLASYAGGDISVSGELLGNAFDSLYFYSDGNGGTIHADILEGHGDFITSNMPLSASNMLFDGGTLSLGDLNATEMLFLGADGDIVFGNAHAGQFDFEADGSVTGGNVVATGRVSGRADGDVELGNINAAGADSASGDFSVGIAAEDSIDVGNVTAGGSVGFATLGDLTTGNVNSGDVFMALVGQDTSLGSVTTPASGRVYIGNASMFLAAGGPDDFDPAQVLSSSPVATGGSITFGGPVSTGKVQAAAGTGLNVGNMTAASSVDLRAGGLASFSGTVSAPNITVTSADIDVADGASLGVFGVTNLITLNARNDDIVIGGEGEGDEGEYYLSEDGDIESNSLVVNAVSSGEGAPDVSVLDVEIEGSQTAGGGISHVTVNTGGSIVVSGDVNYVNAGAADSLTLNAGERIEVVTDTGSIMMTNSAGQLSGSLSLKAHDVWVASQSLLDQLEADPDFEGRDDALATNDGEVNPDGYVQAGGITVTMLGSSFMVQNTGTADDFAGLSVGDGGLTIVNQGNDPATVILFGRKVGSDGTVVGNDDFAGEIVVEGSGGTTSESAVNGCALGGVCGQTDEPEIPPEVASADSAMGPLVTDDSTTQSDDSDDSDDDQEGEDAESDSTDASVHLINTGPLQNSEIIDEPITSGNDGPGGPQ